MERAEPIINLAEVRTTPAQEQLVLEVLRSGRLAQGAMVERFEQSFARIHDSAHAIAVNTGTAALVAALELLDLQPGDEVITTPFTFAATLNAIVECGGTARFADIGADHNVSPDAIDALVNDRTRVVLPVHLFGAPADMTRITDTAGRCGAAIVEDAAQAVGARHRGRSVGTFGMGCFSFYATKNITTGEGGMITTNDDRAADALRMLRNQGLRDGRTVMRGHNLRMTELAAAIGLPQLADLDAIAATRASNTARLRTGLADVPGLLLPPPAPAHDHHVHHQLTVRITGEAPIDRDAFMAEMSLRGIGTRAYYARLAPDAPHFDGHPQVSPDPTPVAALVAAQVVSLPIHPHLAPSDLDRIIDAVRVVLDA